MSAADPFAHLDHLAAPVFVLEVDTRGLPVYRAFNACARAIDGRPLTDYLGRTAAEVYAPPHGQAALARHCEVARTGRPLTCTLEFPRAGELRQLRTTLSPERDVDGNLRWLYGTFFDITAQSDAEQADARQDRVPHSAAVSEAEQLVAMAAHDLRAPMRNVTMLAEVLKEDFVDHGDGKLNLINMMDGIADKTMKLIDDILSHTQSVEAAQTETSFDLTDLTGTICDILDPEGRHQVTVPHARLLTDKTALHLGLRNLIENAMKHAGRSRLLLQVSVEQHPRAMIAVTLEDNGKGFCDAALKLMNGADFRIAGGYGLFAIRRIIRARGGTITARNSSATGGAVIRFTLPGHVGQAGDAASRPRLTLSGPGTSTPPHFYSA